MSKRYLHIGSWNIEHLSKKGGREENAYALAEHIEMASLDILALQELYVTDVTGAVKKNKDLDRVLELLGEHTEQQWYYEIFENRNPGDTSQLCGILWNSSVLNKLDLLKIPVDTFIDGDNTWDRMPHAVKFKYQNKTDFIVIPVHMKSNYGGATKAKRIRHKEAITLINNLDFVKEKLNDHDIIILGDTNCLGSYEKALEVITENGFEDLNGADTGTFVDGKAPFDRIFIPFDQKEFLYSRQYIMVSSNPNDHDRWLSDHYLVKTVFKIRKDDDK